MKTFNRLFVVSLCFSSLLFTSCSDDSDELDTSESITEKFGLEADEKHSSYYSFPIQIGSNVTVANTFQSDAFTGGIETPIEALFGLDEGALVASTEVKIGTEFPSYLLGLYDINITPRSIFFGLVAQADDPNYGPLFRVLEPGTLDRYYLTFDEAVDVSQFVSSDPSVSLRIDSDHVLVVEIGEGFNFVPGAAFAIKIK